MGSYFMGTKMGQFELMGQMTENGDSKLVFVEAQRCEPNPPCLKDREFEFILLTQSC